MTEPFAPTPDAPEARLALAARLWDWHPHPGQRLFLTLRDATGQEPRVLIAACGRRWGKTESIATDAAVRLLTEPDLGQMAVAPTCDQAALLFDAVAERIADARQNPWATETFAHLSDLQTRLSPYPHIRRKSTGATVFSARTAGRTGRSLRGFGTTRTVTRFRVIVDERAFVPDEAIERAIKPMLATSPGGGQLVMISSPNGRRGGFFTDFERGERGEGRYRAVRLPSAQNPRVDAGFLAEMQAEMSERAFRAEFLAEFTDAAGQVFADAETDAAIIADDYGTAALWNQTYVAGADFGRRGDYTVVCVLAVEPDRVRLVDFARWRGIGWHTQGERIADILQKWNARNCVTDGTGIGDPVTDNLRTELQARRANCAVEPFVFSSASKSGLIDTLSLSLSRGAVRFPAHPDLIHELRRYEYETTAHGQTRFAAPSGVHDDTVCALALALHAAREYVRYGGGGDRVTRFVHRLRTDDEKEIRFPCGNFGIPNRAQHLPPFLLPSVYRLARARAVSAFLHKRTRVFRR